MKKYILKQSVFLVSMAFITLVISCQVSEDLEVDTDYKLIQNEGYFPLAVDNKWIYKVRLADLNSDGSIDYDDDSIKTELAVVSSKRMTVDGEKQVRYEFSPIASKGVLGQFLGNFSQIYKNDNGNYFREELKEVTVNNGSTKDSKFVFNLRDIAFLRDDVEVGDIIDEVTHSYEMYAGTKVIIEYKAVSKVTGKFNKIPDIYASVPGVDLHLKNFTNIIQVTDYIEIVSIRTSVNNVSVFMDMTLKGLRDVDGGMNLLIKTYQSGQACVNALASPSFPILDWDGNGCSFKANLNTPLLFIEPTRELSDTAQQDKSKSCPTEADLIINEAFDIPMEIVANEKIISRDTFYAQDVGPIKTIVSTYDIKGQIQLKQTNDFKLSIAQRSTDLNCKFETKNSEIDAGGNITEVGFGRMELILNLDALIDNLFIDIPLSFGLQKSVVMNIDKYDIRRGF